MKNWHYYKHPKGLKVRDPIQGEFFATDVIAKPVEALVREGIQNSLDAGEDGKSVMVRIFASGQDHAVSAEDIAYFMDGDWEHLRTAGNGLRSSDVPADDDDCPFLVFEDFGTTGLQGDESQWEPLEDGKNQFFHFFRAEGRSDKSDRDRGRWGVGKHVFVRSSQVNSTFGLTVRSDDGRSLLMGQTILKTHRIDSVTYQPDGLYGKKESHDGFVLPFNGTDDEELLERFQRVFELERGTDPGLSIVVPWYDLEFTKEALVEAVIKDYFYPILDKRLEVLVEIPDLETTIEADNIASRLDDCDPEFAATYRPLLDLALWARGTADEDKLVLNSVPSTGSPKWTTDLFPDDSIEQIRGALDRGERLALRVPIPVRPKGQATKTSHFDIYLTRDSEDQSGRPFFIRDGIIISDVAAQRRPGIRSLVIIEEEALSTMLGDSENPAHTQWQADGSNFKGKYTYGPSTLKFVRNSVARLISFLKTGEREEDRNALIDVFSLPAPPDEEGGVTTPVTVIRKGPGKGPEPPPTPPGGRKPSPVAIRKRSEGGFVVARGDRSVPMPGLVDIKVAYQTKRGSAFKKYNKQDFQFGKKGVTVDCSRAEVVESNENRLLVRILDDDFSITATGFDKWRDLRVRVLAKEESDAD